VRGPRAESNQTDTTTQLTYGLLVSLHSSWPRDGPLSLNLLLRRFFSMVVQNPPPGLDDDRSQAAGRKFSSAFKDFISLCLQKDPAMRPSAAKLLKHKFFKGKKNRDYLVNTVLADLPSVRERSSMMAVPQTLPPMMPSGAPSNLNWNFSDEEDPLALLAASLESTTMLGTSTTSQQSLEDTKSEGSSHSDASFFDEWFVSPTPSNTMQGRDFQEEEFDRFPAPPSPAPTPANTLQGKDFEEESFGSFPSRPPPTPANTMQGQDFAEEHFGSFPSMKPPPTPANTMQSRDFAEENFDDFSKLLSPAPTPANTMQSADFAEEVFEDFPISNSMPPPPTPMNTMQPAHFLNERFDDLSFASEDEDEDEDDE